MTQKIALREIKKARTKLAIFKSCLSLIEDKTFREIRLEDICAEAEVSKVTFFKFFRRKEDMLVYFMRLWLDQRMLDLASNPRRGLDAVRFLLNDVANGAKDQPGIMLSLISFLSEERMHPAMPVLSDAEIKLLYPGRESAVSPVVPNLGDLFTQFLSEAREDGEVRSDLLVEDMVKMLFSIFYGAYLTAHIYQERDIMKVYELHLQLLTQ